MDKSKCTYRFELEQQAKICNLCSDKCVLGVALIMAQEENEHETSNQKFEREEL